MATERTAPEDNHPSRSVDSSAETGVERRHDPSTARARRSRRLPIPGVLVAIDAPGLSAEPWVVDAIDINADGLGLVLPADLPEETAVELSFRLEAGEFSRLPAVVRHQHGSSGGVRFGTWPVAARLALLEFLVEHYEGEVKESAE